MKKNAKWMPKVGQSYYFITFDSCEFQCDEEVFGVEDGNKFDMPIFPTEDECMEMCSYLNRLLNTYTT